MHTQTRDVTRDLSVTRFLFYRQFAFTCRSDDNGDANPRVQKPLTTIQSKVKDEDEMICRFFIAFITFFHSFFRNVPRFLILQGIAEGVFWSLSKEALGNGIRVNDLPWP